MLGPAWSRVRHLFGSLCCCVSYLHYAIVDLLANGTVSEIRGPVSLPCNATSTLGVFSWENLPILALLGPTADLKGWDFWLDLHLTSFLVVSWLY